MLKYVQPFAMFGAFRSNDEADNEEPAATLGTSATEGVDTNTGTGTKPGSLADEDPLIAHAKRKIGTHVAFIADAGGSDQSLADRIAKTAAGKYSPKEHGFEGKGYVLIVFDSSCNGEASSHPHLRKAPIQAPAIKRALSSSLMARTAASGGELLGVTSIGEDDMYIVFDGGRAGSHHRVE